MKSIPSISSNVNTNTANQTIASPRGKEIQSLLSQKSKLNEEISAVKADKDLDTKMKAERVQSLRTSIQNIDAQIAELKAQEMQEKVERKSYSSSRTANQCQQTALQQCWTLF